MDLTKLRKITRKLFNKAQRSKLEGDWRAYMNVRATYKNEIRKSKRSKWKEFCESVDSISESARLHKLLSKNPNLKPGSMETEPGVYTNSLKDTIAHLFTVHFPGCLVAAESSTEPVVPSGPIGRSDWMRVGELINEKSLLWALQSFTPYKSPGADGIFPALLQKGFQILKGHLLVLFRSCVALGFIPKPWRLSRVVFIPKPGRISYNEAKSYRPICLSSFFLKALERLLDWYIREKCLSKYPLHVNQHAYQKGKSVDSALHQVVSTIEKALNQRMYALGVFIDIEGAFDRTSINSINRSLIEHGVPILLADFIVFILENRRIVTECDSGNLSAAVNRGCPQGGVLSPLIWCMVVDSLIKKLNSENLFTVSYADDFSIIILGKFCDILSELAQRAMHIVQKWCEENELSVNPDKSATVLFTNRRRALGLKQLYIFGRAIKLTDNVKHLGIILDNKLSWKLHIDYKAKKALAIFWQCRGSFGRTWGLSPRSVHWIYTAIARPMFVHAAVVWWPRIKLSSVQAQFAHVQRVACMGILGSFKTTPSAALDTLANLPPLHIFIEFVARKTAIRLDIVKGWVASGHSNSGHRQLLGKMKEESVIYNLPKDSMTPTIHTSINFDYQIPSREDWLNNDVNSVVPAESIICYTDGSLMEGRAGAGIFCRHPPFEESISLGSYTNVFQAEIFAILHCAMHEQMQRLLNERIFICTDSQAAIKAVTSPVIKSPLVKQCRDMLNKLSNENSLVLLWVPGHCHIAGNEKADELARSGSKSHFIGPEPVIGIPICNINLEIRRWCSLQHLQYWHSVPHCRQSKTNIAGPNVKFTKELFNLPRKVLRVVVSTLTGHGIFNYHLHKMNLKSSPACEECNEADYDTTLHFLCECPAFASIRQRFFGSHFIESSMIKTIPLMTLANFVRKSKRFDT